MRQVVIESVSQSSVKNKDNYIKINKLSFRDVVLLMIVAIAGVLTVYAYATESEYFTHLIGATGILFLITLLKIVESIKSENPSTHE